MQLIVKPVSASLTHDTETFSRMDPYVVCVINGQRQKTRTHHEGGKQPRWSDTLTFTVSNFSGMNVQVWDEDPMFDDLVGEGFVDLSGYMSNPGVVKNQNVALTYKGRRAGMVNLSIQLQGGMGMNMGGMGMNMPMGNMGGMGNMGNMGMNNGWGNQPMGNNGWGNTPMNNGWGNGQMNNNGWSGMNGGMNNNGWGNPPSNGWGNMPNNGWGMGNNNGWGM